MILQDIKNKKYNRLTVLQYEGRSKWKCRCECGNVCVIDGAKLKNGHTKSCGCLQKEATKNSNSKHNDCGTRLHIEWLNMKSRCNNPHNKYYYLYGARGIIICKEWNKNYLTFKKWALNNGYTDKLTIDRINVDDNYSPENCRWATWKQQANNTRRTRKYTFGGTILSIKEWSELFNINYGTFKDRIDKRKWEFYKCLGFTTREQAEEALKRLEENKND